MPAMMARQLSKRGPNIAGMARSYSIIVLNLTAVSPTWERAEYCLWCYDSAVGFVLTIYLTKKNL